ncbi:MAG: S1-like domain-containing RNA-binding protein [Bacteroidota bacterium]
MEIGIINKLNVVRITDFGYYLQDENKDEVFLSKSLETEELNIDDDKEVFIYKDAKDRIVATTLKPNIYLDEFAYLKVREISKYGTFMDWGLPKDLMVPYNEQSDKMEEENWYIIYMLKDEKNNRLIGSNKINKFLIFDDIDLKQGDEVDLLLYKRIDLGMNVIVNNKYKGLIFTSDIHKNINLGDKIKGYVKQVREDGKIDIVLEPIGYKDSIDKNSEIILTALKQNEGFLELTDKSNPQDIKQLLGLSKKAFKRSLGNLYKKKIVDIYNDGIKLL